MAQSLAWVLHKVEALPRYVLLALFLLGPQQLMAQDLADPTKPPARLLQANEEGLTTGPILQSILIGANRKLAIIDGQAVKLNGKFGEQTLVRLTETEAVLKRGNTLQVLKLYPDFQKSPVLEKTNTTSKNTEVNSHSSKNRSAGLIKK